MAFDFFCSQWEREEKEYVRRDEIYARSRRRRRRKVEGTRNSNWFSLLHSSLAIIARLHSHSPLPKIKYREKIQTFDLSLFPYFFLSIFIHLRSLPACFLAIRSIRDREIREKWSNRKYGFPVTSGSPLPLKKEGNLSKTAFKNMLKVKYISHA